MNKLVTDYINRARYKTNVNLRFLQYKLIPKKQQGIIDEFHKLFYDSNIFGKTWNNTFFLGTAAQKCPLDLFIYQEIIYELKPDLIIETGTMYGGGALFLASMCELVGKGNVITIDVDKIGKPPKHKRLTYLLGSSTSKEITDKVKKTIKKTDKVLVILDSDHSKKHVLEELKLYHKFVTKGSYIIVEDSNVNGHPVNPNHGPGPMEALEEFMKNNDEFVIDKTREKFYLTFNPNGYLKRIK